MLGRFSFLVSFAVEFPSFVCSLYVFFCATSTKVFSFLETNSLAFAEADFFSLVEPFAPAVFED
jgi:hypothetical protein